MVESILWGFSLRFFQVVVFSTLWVMIGFFVAAAFRVIVGPERTRKLFGGGGIKGLIAGWAWGMLLPVCSLGAIPIVRELHRVGVKGGTLIAFALTVPLFNPLSILYGLTLSDPIAILTFAFCTLVIVSIVGMVWDHFFPPAEGAEAAVVNDEPIDFGLKRMVALFQAATQMMFGPATIYILIGILGSVTTAVFLPHGAMSTMLERDNQYAPLIVAGLGTPIYSTPLLAMSQIGSMFQHGNSIAAAFCLLIFGAGINLGILFCFFRLLGLKKVLGFLALLFMTAISFAYLIGEPLFPKGVEVAGHTHAFDVYTNPFVGPGDYQKLAIEGMKKHWHENEMGGSFIMAGMFMIGSVLMLVNRKNSLSQWIASKSDQTTNDIILPNWVVSAVSIVGLLVLSIAGCYVYYPKPSETLEQMVTANLDINDATRGEWETAMRGIEAQTSWSRLLEVGAFIRTGELSEYHRMKARILRDRLEHLRHAVEDKDLEEARIEARKADQAYRRLRRAYTSNGE